MCPQANELSISLVAAVPAFLIAGSALYGLGRCGAAAGRGPRCCMEAQSFLLVWCEFGALHYQ